MKIPRISLLLSIIVLNLVGLRAIAQIIPDNTLESESSTIKSINELRDRIEGGAVRGENLFHSFEEFNIREGLEVYFANPEEVNNIFSRVTGNNISEIFGTLGVEGIANLFLINPNGIVFGENATVDVGGSFIATTAERVYFENGKVLNVRDRERPLLTWNAPIGLGLEQTSGKIVVRGNGHNFVYTPERLLVPMNDLPLTATQVSTGKNFAFIGNQIEFDGGVINLLSEKIEIGSVRQGKVAFSSSEIDFDYSQVEQFGDLVLDNYSFIIIDGTRAIEANLESSSFDLKNGSLVLFSGEAEFSGNRPQTTNINAREQLLIKGVTTSTPPNSEGLSRGVTSISSRDLNISTKNLIIESGGQIGTLALPGFPNGTINIEATGLVKVSGFIPNNNVLGFSNISTSSVGTENSNNISIKSKDVSVTNGAAIGSSSIDGQSGNVLIEAKTISIEGFSLNNGGVSLPTQVGSSAFGNGVGGKVNLQADRLSVLNGGVVTTSSFSDAEAGSIDINAISITVDNSSGITSFVSRVDPRLIGETPILPNIPLPTGNAGNISLTTNNLTISDRASVTVQNDGTGNAGNIEIDANFINLDTGGNINAAALLGEGGNVTIESNRITLNNSLISASANEEGGNINLNSDRLNVNDSNITAASDSQGGGNINLSGDRFVFQDSNLNASAAEEGDGGNITIDADTVLGINSDITATAVRGNGGNVTIDADGVLGFAEREAIPDNNLSDVDVTSEFGTDGVVVINNPQNTNSDPLVLLVTAPRTDNNLPLSTDCYNEAGEAYVTDSTHPNIPDSPQSYLDEGNWEDEFLAEETPEPYPSPSSSVIEELLWQPGKPYAVANVQIQTPDGRVFAVNEEQLIQVQQKGCLNIEAIKD